MTCVFCAIAAGDIPSAKLVEDETAFAFLDIAPLAPGHALVVPKRHAAKLADCTPTEAGALLSMARRVAVHLAVETGRPDATIAINDGRGAGQEVPHVHVHIVPRHGGDGHGPIHGLFGGPKKVDSEELHDLAVRLQARLEREAA